MSSQPVRYRISAETSTGPSLVVLAAGVGRRFGGAKQLVPIGPSGETLCEYSVFDALRAGFSRVVFVVRKELRPAFEHRFEGRMAKRVPITFVYQTTGDVDAPGNAVTRARSRGTAHALLAVEPEMDGPFAVVNADDFYGAGSFATMSRYLHGGHRSRRHRMALVGFELGRTLSEAGPVSRAICRVDASGRLEALVELSAVWGRGGRCLQSDAEGREVEVDCRSLVSMNLWGFHSTLFPELRRRYEEFRRRVGDEVEAEFGIPLVVQELVEEGQAEVDVLSGAGSWCGLTHAQDLAKASRFIASLVAAGEYPANLWR